MRIATSVPLLHTAQILPIDATGRTAAPGDAAAQAALVVKTTERLLAEAGATWRDVVKLNVAATSNEGIAALMTALQSAHGSRLPPVSTVVGKLAVNEALVALDVVARCTKLASRDIIRPAGFAAATAGAPGKILPAGPRVYVSGQAEAAPSMAEATRLTLESLRKTLAHLNLSLDSVVQVKSFLGPMAQVEDARRALIEFFGEVKTPPLVFVEWTSSLPIEIELIAGGGPAPAPGADAVEFITPPGMQPSPVFCRVTRVNAREVIYLGAAYGASDNAGEAEVREIFEQLAKDLSSAGTDFRHLAKATYYVTTDEASRKLNEIRPKYYDPERPPAASKATVSGTGRKGKTITLDLIAAATVDQSGEKPE